jgi:hypothetical protein
VKIAITKEVADQLPQQVDGKAAAHWSPTNCDKDA